MYLEQKTSYNHGERVLIWSNHPLSGIIGIVLKDLGDCIDVCPEGVKITEDEILKISKNCVRLAPPKLNCE